MRNPLYYNFGFQGPRYAADWDGWPQGSSQYRSAEARGLGDVTDPAAYGFDVPKSGSPYYEHRETYMRAPEMFVPKADSPYWIHKHEWPVPTGAVGLPSFSITTWFLIGLGGVVAMKYKDQIAKAIKKLAK